MADSGEMFVCCLAGGKHGGSQADTHTHTHTHTHTQACSAETGGERMSERRERRERREARGGKKGRER